MGEETTPMSGTKVTKTLSAADASSTRDPIRIVADYLVSKSIIGIAKMKGPRTPRYILLNSNDIFKALVDLYVIHFKANWKKLSPFIIPHGIGTSDAVANLARVYISHWFIDLYVSIRDACLKHECLDTTDYFEKVLSQQSTFYDSYLTLLLQSLKPTHIKGALEDALYIPRITASYHWLSRDKNYFGITNFTLNHQIFQALLSHMKSPSSGWHTATPSNDPAGRPFWLFDWHFGKAYAWFPEEENYNIDDVVLAFILGVACTPLQSPRDKDAPQQFPQNQEPEQIDIKSLVRKTPKRFHGSIGVRTVEKEQLTIRQQMEVQVVRPVLALTQGSRSEASAEGFALAQRGQQQQATETVTEMQNVDYRVNLYKIVDYNYFAVVRKGDVNVRAASHEILIFKNMF